MRIAIVGAGPSALVAAKTLLEAADADPAFKPEITLFEAEAGIGGTFRYRTYSNATLVSSKQLTSFSDFRLPLEHKDHLTLDEYVQYLEDYTAHFKLKQRCDFRFRTSVIKSVKVEGGHLLRFRSLDPQSKDAPDRSELFTHLCVCSGLHVTPALPQIPGLPPTIQGDQVVTDPMGSAETVASRVHEPIRHAANASEILTLHSSQFKDRSLYRGKRVMVLGTGETGMDMAYEAVKAGAKEVVLCTRSGFLLFPAVLADFVVFGNVFDGNLPIDGLITNLFETTYVHPWVAAAHLRWFISDFVIKRLLWCLTGTQAGCNQWVGELEPHRLGRAYTFLNKSSKAMPYINRGWKSRSPFLERITSYLDPPTVKPEEVSIDLAPFPARVNEDGTVEFLRNGRKEDLRMRNRTVKPDVVVYATGYTQQFDFLSKEYPVPATVRCRDVFDPEDPTIAFIGFVRPGVGAIPPIAEMQVQLWTLILRNRIPAPLSTPHYYLLVKKNARIKYGVDYSSYVSTLARDMGTAPPLGKLLWTYGPKVTLIYCFGAAFPTFYRLLGPYRHPDAKRIVETEIYDTIRRRGVVGNLMMGLIPMIFYAWINLAAYILEKVWNVVSAFTRPFSPRRSTSMAGQQQYQQTWSKARRFQSDFEASSVTTLKMPDKKSTAGQTKPRGRMLRFFALFSALLAVTTTGVEANTEIRNFGPVLCRSDEYGHLAAKAADQLSSNWPVLRPSTTPSLFSVVPERLSDSTHLNDSKAGAWLVLDLSDGGSFVLPAPRQAGLYAELNPRDRWVRQWIDGIAWFFTKRFTVRASISAHLAVGVGMQLVGPEEVLARGGVEWEAEAMEKEAEVVEGEGEGMMSEATTRLPNHVVVQSVVPRQTQTAKEDATVLSKTQHPTGPAEILASDTIHLERDAANAPRFPCPKVYLHLVVHETGVPIPAALDLANSASVWTPVFRLAELLFGSLASVSGDEASKTAPIHLTLERLYLGGVPATAMSMALPMAAMLLLAWVGVRPVLHGILPSVGKEGKDH